MPKARKKIVVTKGEDTVKVTTGGEVENVTGG